MNANKNTGAPLKLTAAEAHALMLAERLASIPIGDGLWTYRGDCADRATAEALDARGLVVLSCRYIRITPAGRAALAQHESEGSK